MEDLSCLVSDILDCIGYSRDIIRVRRNYWQQRAHLLSEAQGKHTTLIITGSKAEGITALYESDVDHMILLNDAICTDGIHNLPPVSNMTVLHADTSEAPPGYTRLRLISCNGPASISLLIESVYESASRDAYISSSLFAEGNMNGIKRCNNHMFTCNELSGPAIPVNIENISVDNVLAFSCYQSKLLQTWKSRRRLYNWPPTDVCEAAASELSQVVPVGSKGSLDQSKEWRFCFIPSELKLTYSLNETQIKLYILLKMVAKNILRNVSNEISSYIMKNITFWLSELHPEDVFIKNNLFSLLFLSLRFLKSAITKWNWLPYYMIPGRNLLAERLSYDDRRQLSDLIETLLTEGPQFILRCPKLQIPLTVSLSSPSILADYKSRRNILEILTFSRYIPAQYKADKSIILSEIGKILELILPQWKILLSSGIPLEIIACMVEKLWFTMLS